QKPPPQLLLAVQRLAVHEFENGSLPAGFHDVGDGRDAKKTLQDTRLYAYPHTLYALIFIERTPSVLYKYSFPCIQLARLWQRQDRQRTAPSSGWPSPGRPATPDRNCSACCRGIR